MSEERDWNGIKRAMTDAKQWLETPWVLQDDVDRTDRHTLFMYEAAKKSQLAWQTFDEIWSWMDVSAMGSVQWLLEDMQSNLTRTAIEEETAAPIDAIDEGGGYPRPSWATLEFSVDAWWCTLEEKGCDDTAKKALFGLAQMGEEGKVLAQDIIMKVQYADIRKPSAWVHKSAVGAQMRVETIVKKRLRLEYEEQSDQGTDTSERWGKQIPKYEPRGKADDKRLKKR